MSSKSQIILALSLGLCSFSLSGCGSSQPVATPEAATLSKLNDVAELYRVYSITNKKPPKSKVEAAKMENAVPSGLTPINSGDIIVLWGGELTDLNEEPTGPKSDKILAYEKDVPAKGGKVLLLDRNIKTMTPEEFAAAPKAAEPATEPPKKK